MQLYRVNYDEIAAEYDRRYQASPMKPVGSALKTVLGGLGAARVLEVGCGTGHWLAELAAPRREMFGLASMGMLRTAQAKLQFVRLPDPRAGRECHFERPRPSLCV